MHLQEEIILESISVSAELVGLSRGVEQGKIVYQGVGDGLGSFGQMKRHKKNLAKME